ncbi:HAD family hydrolase [Candidatus Chrysopegis kryptomonas]|uniref:phosphoglycolate phosphatase n=1 Tax=Candidatus Chryseopegocella kryptomonas TaxID=1633643 RepID=A0A0P1MVT8_9BACT|nr:HAD-IA family hydrolase [Candidatus Chrysopegis kryptomonas]CUT00085.1 haloacid dehalogenase superfamily, subfamily IA, variant 3 with third motif having DD or ED/haloacid dehalogenase superfamily, subfamily IA, variant 1 with third motif having Dx(3-4)D or Dx(3-4)E [Candidatus Chrysopegis kryptomonas]
MKIKCVIFDLDGTIAQTNELIFETFNYIAKKYTGKIFTPEEITTQFFGPPEEGGIRKLLELSEDENVKKNFDEFVKVAVEEFYEYYRSNHHKARVYEGIKDLLSFLKSKGLKLAIFTGKGKITTSITLEKLGLTDFFDIIITGDDVKFHKPSGEGIKKILDELALTPDEAILVGDAVSDVKAGKEAGVKVISALWDSYGKEKVISLKPDFVVYSVSELRKLLEKFISGVEKSGVILKILVLFFAFVNFLSAQDKVEIKGLRVYSYEDEIYPPIIVRFDTLWNGEPNTANDYIVIEFDVKYKTVPDLGIRFYHCDRNWRRTENIFVQSFFHSKTLYLNYTVAEKGIKGYNFHFKNIFPDPDGIVQFPYSGNYIFEIYDRNADTIVYASGRFIVVDKLTDVNARLSKVLLGEKADFKNYVNQIDIEVSIPDSLNWYYITTVDIYENWKIYYPYRVDFNERKKFTYVSGFPSETRIFKIWNIYPLNEYRQIDIRSEKIYPNGYPVIPVGGVDKVRKFWQGEQDMNGGCKIVDEGMYSDYLEVNFRLEVDKETEQKIKGDIFIVGCFNNWKPSVEDVLKYDPLRNYYFVKKWLKRGIYDYQYVVGYYDASKDDVIVIDWFELEGNDWQTKNAYYIVVYYRDVQFGGFDRIVGFAKIEG